MLKKLIGTCRLAKKWVYSMIAIAVILMIAAPVILGMKKDKPVEVVTESALKQIINISDLSTFQVTYRGVAEVMNEKNPEKVSYYILYHAKAYAGIDFSQIKVQKDDENKKILLTLPEVTISDPEVDITSLEYMFLDQKADNVGITEQAYKACEEDVVEESKTQENIYELARDNAQNVLKALTNPIIQQALPEYTLVIE